MRIAALFLLVACGSSKPAKPEIDPKRANDVMASYAARCLACNNDKDCVHKIRDEYEPYMRSLHKSRESFIPADATAFDESWWKFQRCGDAAGLTIWKH